MKYILLILIRIYWLTVPERKRRSCLFKESCSRFVYRIAADKGLKEGIVALNKRFHQCRPGYRFLNWHDGVELHLKDGTFIKEEYVSPHLLIQKRKSKAV